MTVTIGQLEPVASTTGGVKYVVAPSQMPEHLTWHKWQSYTTWLSGAALLMIIYWVKKPESSENVYHLYVLR